MHLRDTVVQGRMSTELRRQLREDPRPLPWISGATPHHAQLAEAAGFRLFGISGSQAAAHIMGMPDAGLMTLTEVADNIRRVCQSVTIPVIADCETGFGNVVNTTRAVHDFIAAGAAGFFLEDQSFPKRCGFTKGVEVIPIPDAVAKYRAACAMRDRMDPDVVVIARTDSRAAVGGSVEEVLRRCEAYLAAGADMLMVMALQSREEMRRVMEAFPDAAIYINASSVRPALTHAEYLEFGVASYNVSISKVAQIMMQRFLAEYRERGADAFNDFMAEAKAQPRDTFAYLELTGFPAVLELERKFLPEEQLSKYELSLGEYDPRA
jgi:2-methylisocitrate lyase-like PEP mutase family enzyme